MLPLRFRKYTKDELVASNNQLHLSPVSTAGRITPASANSLSTRSSAERHSFPTISEPKYQSLEAMASDQYDKAIAQLTRAAEELNAAKRLSHGQTEDAELEAIYKSNSPLGKTAAAAASNLPMRWPFQTGDARIVCRPTLLNEENSIISTSRPSPLTSTIVDQTDLDEESFAKQVGHDEYKGISYRIHDSNRLRCLAKGCNRVFKGLRHLKRHITSIHPKRRTEIEFVSQVFEKPPITALPYLEYDGTRKNFSSRVLTAPMTKTSNMMTDGKEVTPFTPSINNVQVVKDENVTTTALPHISSLIIPSILNPRRSTNADTPQTIVATLSPDGSHDNKSSAANLLSHFFPKRLLTNLNGADSKTEADSTTWEHSDELEGTKQVSQQMFDMSRGGNRCSSSSYKNGDLYPRSGQVERSKQTGDSQEQSIQPTSPGLRSPARIPAELEEDYNKLSQLQRERLASKFTDHKIHCSIKVIDIARWSQHLKISEAVVEWFVQEVNAYLSGGESTTIKKPKVMGAVASFSNSTKQEQTHPLKTSSWNSSKRKTKCMICGKELFKSGMWQHMRSLHPKVNSIRTQEEPADDDGQDNSEAAGASRDSSVDSSYDHVIEPTRRQHGWKGRYRLNNSMATDVDIVEESVRTASPKKRQSRSGPVVNYSESEEEPMVPNVNLSLKRARRTIEPEAELDSPPTSRKLAKLEPSLQYEVLKIPRFRENREVWHIKPLYDGIAQGDNDYIQRGPCQGKVKTRSTNGSSLLCAACTSRRTDSGGCRFANLRKFIDQLDGPDTPRYVLTSCDQEAAKVDDTIFSVDGTEVDCKYALRCISQNLEDVLNIECTHETSEHILRRSREKKIRPVCDSCATTIFSGHWVCYICAKEICLDCYNEWDDADDRVEFYHTSTCVKRKTSKCEVHLKAHMIPYSRFEEDEVNVLLSQVARHPPYVPGPVGIGKYIRKTEEETDSLAHAREHVDNVTLDIFKRHWSTGEPLVLTGMSDRLKTDWSPDYFIRNHTDEHVYVADIGKARVTSMALDDFFARLQDPSSRENLKLKDWPNTSDFAAIMPKLFEDFEQALPYPIYTRRKGFLNLASWFPPDFLPPDLGPKLYCAHRSSDGSTYLS